MTRVLIMRAIGTWMVSMRKLLLTFLYVADQQKM
jgi:hypothetical protein